MPTTESLLKLWGRVRPLATILTMVAIGFAIVQYITRNWTLITGYSWQLDWVWVPASVIAMSMFFLGLSIGWRSTIAWNCVPPPWPASLWVWSRSSLARYLPTPVWFLASRIYLATQLGVPWRSASFSMGMELVGAICGAFTISLLAVSLWVEVSTVLLISAMALVPGIALPITYSFGLRLLRRINVSPNCGYFRLTRWSVQYSLTFAIFGLANILVLKSLGLSIPPVHLVLGISAFSWVLGTLNVFSPSGLGTREIILAIGLESYLSPPELLTFSVGSRLAAVSGELLLCGAIYFVKIYSEAKASNITPEMVTLQENVSS